MMHVLSTSRQKKKVWDSLDFTPKESCAPNEPRSITQLSIVECNKNKLSLGISSRNIVLWYLLVAVVLFSGDFLFEQFFFPFKGRWYLKLESFSQSSKLPTSSLYLIDKQLQHTLANALTCTCTRTNTDINI